MLPLLLNGNEKVHTERLNVIKYFKEGNFKKLKKSCQKYKVKIIDCKNINSLNDVKLKNLKNFLLNRVNVFPISMMLAQAIVESGWGGSRFAQKGNALLGNGHGIKKGNFSNRN